MKKNLKVLEEGSYKMIVSRKHKGIGIADLLLISKAGKKKLFKVVEIKGNTVKFKLSK